MTKFENKELFETRMNNTAQTELTAVVPVKILKRMFNNRQ